MFRFLCVAVFSLTMVGKAQCQGQTNASRTLDSSQKKLVSQLTTQWKAYFRAISTLDMHWQSSDYFFGPHDRHTYNYHFWREPGRYRLDTRFYSQKSTPNYTKDSTVLGVGQFVKDLSVSYAGNASLLAPYPQQQRNPYGIVLPILNVFGWAKDSQSERTLEGFSRDDFWQRFADRVTAIESGSWQQRRGWWLTAKEKQVRPDKSQNERTVRFFVDSATFFPLLTLGKIHFESKDYARDTAYEVRVTKTQSWITDGITRLLPLGITSREWRHNLSTGVRTSQTDSVKSLAAIKINAVIPVERWKLAVPAKTFVTYSLRPNPRGEDYQNFSYDPHGGTLWMQLEHERQRIATNLSRLRALPIIYDEKADGEAQIAAALKLATAQNKSVLLQFGAYWCSPCHTLHDLLDNDPLLSPLVKDNYISVPIDLNNGHNATVAKRLMGSGQGGIPFLVILDAQGNRVAAPPTEYFTPSQGNKEFDTEKLATFLNRWKQQP